MTTAERVLLANDIRKETLFSLHAAKSGHPGGCLSCIELLTYLYFEQMDLNRDRFILSKGHAAPALYAALAIRGLLEKDETRTLRQLGSRLQGHPSRTTLPYVETNTGSLGQGFSVAVGMALGEKFYGNSGNIYCLVGDGELQEGIVWEAAMFASHHCLNNLCVIVDRNWLQSDKWTERSMRLNPLLGKWWAFGWNAIEIDGHQFSDIERGFRIFGSHEGQPTVLIANTIKGRGVSFMESQQAWHGSRQITDDELERMMEELEAFHVVA